MWRGSLLFPLCAIAAVWSPGARGAERIDVGKDGFIAVRDGVLKSGSLKLLTELLLYHTTWRYVGEQGAPSVEEPALHALYADSGWPWLATLNTTLLAKSSAAETLRGVVVELTGRDDYELQHAVGVLLRRGDETRMTGGATATEDDTAQTQGDETSSASGGDLQPVNLFLELTARPWEKNDYGETLFYTPSGQKTVSGVLEVQEAVHLRHGRLLAWTDEIPFTLRPPSMNKDRARCGVLLKFAVQKPTSAQAAEKYTKPDTTTPASQSGNRQFPSGDQQADGGTDSKPSRQFADSRGEPVAVFDDVLSSEAVATLQKYLLSEQPQFKYQFANDLVGKGDAEATGSGIPWSATFSPVSFANSSYWLAIKHLVSMVSEQDGWYPLSVTQNALRNADAVRVHADSTEKDNEYSVLLHLNGDFSENAHGSTVFYEQGEWEEYEEELDESAMEGMEEEGQQEAVTSRRLVYDVISGVRPRAGRIVVFPSCIPYAFRPPRSDRKGVQHILTVRLASGEQLAKAKLLDQVLSDDLLAGQEQAAERRAELRQKLPKLAASDSSAEDDSLSVDRLDLDLSEHEERLLSLRRQAAEATYQSL